MLQTFTAYVIRLDPVTESRVLFMELLAWRTLQGLDSWTDSSTDSSMDNVVDRVLQ